MEIIRFLLLLSLYFIFTVDEGDSFPEDANKRISRDSESKHIYYKLYNQKVLKSIHQKGEVRVTTPTATESTLPWKRGDEQGEDGALQQNEFPSWASNKEYLAYNSPSATFLGNIMFHNNIQILVHFTPTIDLKNYYK